MIIMYYIIIYKLNSFSKSLYFFVSCHIIYFKWYPFKDKYSKVLRTRLIDCFKLAIRSVFKVEFFFSNISYFTYGYSLMFLIGFQSCFTSNLHFAIPNLKLTLYIQQDFFKNIVEVFLWQ